MTPKYIWMERIKAVGALQTNLYDFAESSIMWDAREYDEMIALANTVLSFLPQAVQHSLKQPAEEKARETCLSPRSRNDKRVSMQLWLANKILLLNPCPLNSAAQDAVRERLKALEMPAFLRPSNASSIADGMWQALAGGLKRSAKKPMPDATGISANPQENELWTLRNELNGINLYQPKVRHAVFSAAAQMAGCGRVLLSDQITAMSKTMACFLLEDEPLESAASKNGISMEDALACFRIMVGIFKEQPAQGRHVNKKANPKPMSLHKASAAKNFPSRPVSASAPPRTSQPSAFKPRNTR
jgi:hypothetical protein